MHQVITFHLKHKRVNTLSLPRLILVNKIKVSVSSFEMMFYLGIYFALGPSSVSNLFALLKTFLGHHVLV